MRICTIYIRLESKHNQTIVYSMLLDYKANSVLTCVKRKENIFFYFQDYVHTRIFAVLILLFSFPKDLVENILESGFISKVSHNMEVGNYLFRR